MVPFLYVVVTPGNSQKKLKKHEKNFVYQIF